jgi:hypothetical protein
MNTEKPVEVKTVKMALTECRRALREAEQALTAMNPIECRNALERLQHAAFDAKDLFQH